MVISAVPVERDITWLVAGGNRLSTHFFRGLLGLASGSPRSRIGCGEVLPLPRN
jgi:hypothetical protein